MNSTAPDPAPGVVGRSRGARVNAIALDGFRIGLAVVLLGDVAHLFSYRRLIFDPTPFLDPASRWLEVVLVAWMASLVGLAAGWRTRAMAIANYAFCVAILGGLRAFHYHADYLYVTASFLMVFLPVANRIAIDVRQGRLPMRRDVPVYLATVASFLTVGVTYFDSLFWKLASPFWREGLGFWLPASMPFFAWVDIAPVLNLQGLSLAAGYTALAFEAVFPVLVWWPPARSVLFLFGALFHLCITVTLPVLFFGPLVVALLIPLTAPARPRVSSHAADGDPNRRIWAAVVLGAIFLQVVSIGTSPGARAIAGWLGLGGVASTLSTHLRPVTRLTGRFLGIHPHGVFHQRHFDVYDEIYTIRAVDPAGGAEWLPLLDEDGRPGAWAQGRLSSAWVYWYTGPEPSAGQLTAGMERYTAWWRGSRGWERTENVRFELLRRHIRVPDRWRKDALEDAFLSEWQVVGRARWTDEHFSFTWIAPDEPQ